MSKLDTEAILTFWFGPPDGPDRDKPQRKWFMKDDAFDKSIEDTFGAVVESALSGAYDDVENARNALALIITLDQFTRNAFRGTPRSFAGDPRALALAHRAIRDGWDRELRPVERWFLYMPLMHSETRDDQRLSCELYDKLAAEDERADARKFARLHADIIEKFGRFPHRNTILDRTSTGDEVDFLQQPGSSF